MSIKFDARKSFKSIISSYTEDERLLKSRFIENNLRDLISHQAQGLWAGFQSLPTEPSIQFQNLKDVSWVFPKIQQDKMSFYKSDSFEVSAWGILEPVSHDEIELKDINGVCIPALAYSQSGRRLGRGKGYYDKTLSGFSGLKIGVCYNDCVSDNVPYEEHDLCVDYIVTEKNILTIRGVN